MTDPSRPTDAKADAPADRPDPLRRFFGRRRGPRLSPRKQALIDTLLPRLRVGLPDPADPASAAGADGLDPARLFDRPIDDLWLEIGFGKGEHLAWQAGENPRIGFIGCEPYQNGLAALLDRIDADGLGNVRVYDDDARDVIDALPDASVGRIFLLQPDPWPKARHARRRLVNPEPLDAMARILRPGGELRLSTDDPTYKAWMAVQIAQRSDFRWTAERPADWRRPSADWPITRYASKAEREGRTPVFFRLVRTKSPG
ncbi:tRNA (guanosine(46)-N7)-methyltransferase TrmB [Rhodothalassium salexigens]|uniref:tRNA (guanine(46)-N(7))-methyltransferase TrmB n=1 Tax=Rhodothalassium salexigens TaxID=1086 RepID=UPI0019119B10|nr:tRNA (guanine(46)-N(7))-methyltransferase TrmB [Rhodothalassium salexigens]MBK5921467.1 tRNA (guanosine(46)-N7)-methyltransferase TrmB [Rhodothalassium salexigens]